MTCEHAFTFSLFALRNKDERTGAIITAEAQLRLQSKFYGTTMWGSHTDLYNTLDAQSMQSRVLH